MRQRLLGGSYTWLIKHDHRIPLAQPENAATVEHALSEQHESMFKKTHLTAQIICPTRVHLKEAIKI